MFITLPFAIAPITNNIFSIVSAFGRAGFLLMIKYDMLIAETNETEEATKNP
jgi:hypothetical protein